MNNSKKGGEAPVLLSELVKVVEKCQRVYVQGRVYRRVLGLVMAELFALGRHTVTQLLLGLGLSEGDWSAWYRLFSKKRFEEKQTSEVMLKEMLSEVAGAGPFVVGVDGFPVPRCSQTMPGTGWMRGLRTAKFKPGIQRGQRFVEGSWLTPLVNGFSRAIPLRCLSAFTAKAVASEEGPRTEVQGGLEILQWVRSQMDAAGRQEQGLLSLHDGSYDTLDFWAKLPERTRAVVRTARNRALYHLPADDAHGNCRYGEKAPAPKAWLKQRKGFQRQEVLVRGTLRRMRYRVEGPFVRDGLPDVPLFLIVVGGGQRPPGSRRKHYDPCFFLVSAVPSQDGYALPLPIADLLAWLWQRWELEVAHRQMKSDLGLGEKQAWNPAATVATVQWSLWLYALMMLAGYRAWGNDCGASPPGRWRAAPKRWSFNTLWRALRIELWQHPDFRTTWSPSRNNWLQFEPLYDNLFNAILAAART
jgi:DDE superfamily endonuclease